MKKLSTFNFQLSTLLILGGFFICLTGAQAASLGEQVVFNVDAGYDISDRTQLSATLRAIGANIYFYVEDDYWTDLDGTYKNALRETLEELADEFDQVIYPKERAVFGSEWNPGIDNDKRITVLITQLVNNKSEEEELEVEEFTWKGKQYYVTGKPEGLVFEYLDGGDIGEEIGNIKDGKVFFS